MQVLNEEFSANVQELIDHVCRLGHQDFINNPTPNHIYITALKVKHAIRGCELDINYEQARAFAAVGESVYIKELGFDDFTEFTDLENFPEEGEYDEYQYWG